MGLLPDDAEDLLLPDYDPEVFATLLGGRHAGNQPEPLRQSSSHKGMLSS